MWKADRWEDYALLDTSDGQRLEKWGKYVLCRPDPQVIWKNVKSSPLWKKADAVYEREGGGGSWRTGLFPEQAVNWDWFSALIRNEKRPVKVLNLFAYTGGATIAAAAAGASVCHVDAAKNMVAQAKENAALSGLEVAPIRYIVDDCKKFVEREIRRGNRYDAVIMDPPSYGRGPSGEIWKLEDNIAELIRLAADVLSDKPLFFLVNSYTTGLSPSAMGYMLGLEMKKRFGGRVEADEIGIPVIQTGEALPCGSSARWTAE